ncbi:hypothetical protein B0G69_2596 [Paraburkholderia sp. RAU2J]|nr:hypothetical protein B0G69_2596 [Paraburkholderia sp. RAU2J]
MKSCGGRDGATRVSTSSPATARLTHSTSPRSALRLIVKRTGSSATIPRAEDLSATAARAHHKSKAHARGGLVMKRCRGSIRVAWGAVSPRLRGGSDSAHVRRRSVAQMPRLSSAKSASRAAREGLSWPSAGPRGKNIALRPGQRAPQSTARAIHPGSLLRARAPTRSSKRLKPIPCATAASHTLPSSIRTRPGNARAEGIIRLSHLFPSCPCTALFRRMGAVRCRA